MGYLSQKKKETNTRELLNISLGIVAFCCFFILFLKETAVAGQISHWLFQIYIYALVAFIYACFSKFYWQAGGLLCCVVILFFNIEMGGNLFSNVKTQGSQKLTILYQADASSPQHMLDYTYKYKSDISAVLTKGKGNIKTYLLSSFYVNPADGGMIITSHNFLRSGEVLLSKNGRAAFADLKISLGRLVFMALDFSKISLMEQKTALHNLAEFINMQDVPVIIVGHFGQEAWSADFLNFLEKTNLEVKNEIILSDAKQRFNPFKIPTINILAYKDFGLEDIRFLPANKKDPHPLLIKLNY